MHFSFFLCYKRSIILTAFISTILTFFIGNAFAQTSEEITLNFSAQKIFTSSAPKTFTIRGRYLAGPVTVKTSLPFQVSKDSVIYESSLTYDTVELVSNQTVYVKFKPTAVGNYADSVVSISEGADSKIINLTGKASLHNSASYKNRLDANNVITPNGDGRNDTWVINGIEQYPNNTVKVMDKSGNVVYSKSGYLNDWNGTYHDSPLPQGTYYYVVDFGEGPELVFKGFITIVSG